MNRPEEPLEESAALALGLARRLCREDPDTGNNCAWLHGFWQGLRLAGLAATPDRHLDFYQAAFRGIGQARPRLLISGAADYGMLACALAALRTDGAEPDVTVIDSCETPLHLNRWYAARVGNKIDTRQCSVLAYAPAAPFDAVCTHSFFGQFSREQRPRLIAAWARLLRGGGKVITTHPLRPWGADEQNRFTPAQEQAFRAALEENDATLRRALGIARSELEQLADEYLRARYGYPVRSGEELGGLFEQAGFRLVHLSVAPAPADARPGTGGPGLRNPDVKYAHIIAQLP